MRGTGVMCRARKRRLTGDARNCGKRGVELVLLASKRMTRRRTSDPSSSCFGGLLRTVLLACLAVGGCDSDAPSGATDSASVSTASGSSSTGVASPTSAEDASTADGSTSSGSSGVATSATGDDSGAASSSSGQPEACEGYAIEATFETVAVGEPAAGSDGLSSAFATVVSDAQAHGGERSAQCSIDEGADGFGAWGGSLDFPDLHEGDEIWFRMYVYFPKGFDFWTDSGYLKLMRIHTAADNSDNEGYHDLFIMSDGSGVAVGSEVAGPEGWHENNDWRSLGTPVVPGQWYALEMYVLHSSEHGIFRAWQDGVLVLEDTESFTLRSPTSIADFIYIFSYWNGSAPASQSAFIDDVVVTFETPCQVDADGNPMIGL